MVIRTIELYSLNYLWHESVIADSNNKLYSKFYNLNSKRITAKQPPIQTFRLHNSLHFNWIKE